MIAMKPEREPLPRCDALGLTYHRANLVLSAKRPGWRDWQSGRPMGAIIPAIDALVEAEGPQILAGPFLPPKWLGIGLT